MISKFRIRFFPRWGACLFSLLLLVLASCETNMVIINDVDEREANEIVVFLASKDIKADKVASKAVPAPGGGATISLWNIAVEPGKTTEAMALLNQNGLPRIKGTTLLDLFAKQGLMTSEREETIRYQQGLGEDIANTIRKIDGVIDATVQISFPPANAGTPGGPPQTKVTASVYVKHQGVLDDPNSHLVTKIKRLVASSVTGLDVNDVTVISDRSRLTDMTFPPAGEALTPKEKEYVSIWSIVMSKSSASRFRFLFFILIFATVLFALLVGWMVWKFYPILRKKGGLKALLHPVPIEPKEHEEEEETKEEK